MINNNDFETGIQFLVIGFIVLLYGIYLSKKSLKIIKKDIEVKKESKVLTFTLFLKETFLALLGLFLLVVGIYLIIKNRS